MDHETADTGAATAANPPGVVVGVALVRAGHVLAARRTRPAAAAGRWEFPGGKVEPGESEGRAARREITEELGCDIHVGGRVGGEVALGSGHVLRVLSGEIVEGEPEPTEHDLLRWLGPDALEAVDWLDADRPFLPAVEALLRGDRELVEAHFDEGDDAETVVATLEAEGHEAYLDRESFAGEDDSEDRAWLVRVESAPAAVLLRALVADVELAWIVDEAPVRPSVASVPPAPLPTSPKRLQHP